MTGKVLLIDLTEKNYATIRLTEADKRAFIGGRGMCGLFLYEYLSGDPLIFFTGPLTGTGYPMTDRCSVAHVSPYTGGLFRSSFGGQFGTSLKQAGYDGLIITGTSPSKTCVVIDTEITFSDRIPDGYSYIKHGKAAEYGIKHTGLICDGSFATHRGSTGYSMFQKNLEAVCIKLPEEISSPDNHAKDDIDRLINASPALTGRLSIKNYGTAALYDLAFARGMLPHNFCGKMPDEKANAYAMLKNLEYQNYSCGHCPVECKKSANGAKLPDYDDFAMLLASGVDIKELPTIYSYCFEMGYDITTLCHQLFFYDKKEIPIRELISGYAQNAELQNIVSPLKIKGLEIPAFDPRGAMGFALGYTVSTNGADWRTTMAITHEILRKPVATDRFATDGKAVINIASENAVAAAESLNVCGYALFSVSLEEYANAMSEHTGESYTPAELAESGAIIINNERAIIRQLGFSEADDTLPEIFFNNDTESLSRIDRDSFMHELEKYHRMRDL